MFSRNLTMRIAAGAATVAVAAGALAIGNSSSSSSASASANGTPSAHTTPGPGPRTTPAPGAASGPVPAAVYGRLPTGWHPGSGTSVSGAAADRAKAAAIAKFPGGTVNRVLQLSDGSYAVHIIGTSGPHHVFVGQNLKVTGAA